jgi:hypothetical protein
LTAVALLGLGIALHRQLHSTEAGRRQLRKPPNNLVGRQIHVDQ